MCTDLPLICAPLRPPVTGEEVVRAFVVNIAEHEARS
jgi:hypothetical protein